MQERLHAAFGVPESLPLLNLYAPPPSTPKPLALFGAARVD